MTPAENKTQSGLNVVSSNRINQKRLISGILTASFLSVCLIFYFEFQRLQIFLQSDASLFDWLLTFDLETLYFLGLPVLLFFTLRKRVESPENKKGKSSKETEQDKLNSFLGNSLNVAWGLSSFVLLLSILMSYLVSQSPTHPELSIPLGSLPPAYHDEYSYLFQAETFAAGHVSFPSSEIAPEIFDQMHVLNEGRFASRYFPGTGLWMTPFLKAGHVYWGHWLAGGLTAFFFFWAGRELGDNYSGLIAGMLTALSPGMGIFSNLLLAHHPTMMGLSLFLFCMLRFMRTGTLITGLFAGVGLTFAMLCRPMTAAGFALPFGLWALYRLIKVPANLDSSPKSYRVKILFSLGIPLLFGFLILFLFNKDITGNGSLTPYQVYTDTYTPRHVYGFNNRIRGEKKLGPKVLTGYDEWAENLTPALAWENEKKRTLSSLQWSLGLLPLLMGGILFLFLLPELNFKWWLIFGSIILLHLVHIPYWFVGIMNWHYVFESGPMWLLMIAGVTVILKQSSFNHSSLKGFYRWWIGLLCLTVLLNWNSFDSSSRFESSSKVQNAVREIAFPRLKYEQFRLLLESQVSSKPALVMVKADPADRSMDYVNNVPQLDSEILIGRFRPEIRTLDDVAKLFPNRSVYLYDVKENSLRKVSKN